MKAGRGRVTHRHHGLGDAGEHCGPQGVQQDLALQQDEEQQRGAVLRAQVRQQGAEVRPTEEARGRVRGQTGTGGAGGRGTKWGNQLIANPIKVPERACKPASFPESDFFPVCFTCDGVREDDADPTLQTGCVIVNGKIGSFSDSRQMYFL